MTARIYFAHGKESGPWGRKIKVLAAAAEARGFSVESPDYRFTQDPDARVRHLLDLHPVGAPLVLVGSSMGGYVSTIASRSLKPKGLFLLAPAVYMAGYPMNPAPVAEHVEIVHGWRDDIVPVDNVIRFAREQGAGLHLLDAGHTLVEELSYIEVLFGLFLERLQEQTAPTGSST